jgi:hypothetical protein
MTPEAARARAADYRKRSDDAKRQSEMMMDSAMRSAMLSVSAHWLELAKAADQTAEEYERMRST